MKALAIFGGAGALTAVVAGTPAAIVLGNLAIMATSVALLGGTLGIDRGTSRG
ncbi:MAG: hypothetical protein ACE366_06255 [Bradymonadia bacterium]